MLDCLKSEMPKPDDMSRTLTRQADIAFANGDEERCIMLIECIYELLDGETRDLTTPFVETEDR